MDSGLSIDIDHRHLLGPTNILKDFEYLVHVLIRTILTKKAKVKNGFCIQYFVYFAKWC